MHVAVVACGSYMVMCIRHGAVGVSTAKLKLLQPSNLVHKHPYYSLASKTLSTIKQQVTRKMSSLSRLSLSELLLSCHVLAECENPPPFPVLCSNPHYMPLLTLLPSLQTLLSFSRGLP